MSNRATMAKASVASILITVLAHLLFLVSASDKEPAESLLLGFVAGLAFLSSGVLFLRWTYLATDELGGSEVRGDAVWAFFVPVLNLWRPYIVIRDLWVHAAQKRTGTMSFAVGFWWGCSLAAGSAANSGQHVVSGILTVGAGVSLAGIILAIERASQVLVVPNPDPTPWNRDLDNTPPGGDSEVYVGSSPVGYDAGGGSPAGLTACSETDLPAAAVAPQTPLAKHDAN